MTVDSWQPKDIKETCRVDFSLHKHSSMRRLFSMWVPCLFCEPKTKIVLVSCLKIDWTCCNNGRNLDPPLYSRVYSEIGWVDSSWLTSPKADKNGTVGWNGMYGILGINYFKKSQTINGDHYVAQLVHLKKEIITKIQGLHFELLLHS